MPIKFIASRYSKRDLWSFFLTCAFPLHFWTLLLVLRDAGWIAERTKGWDVIGVASYAMLIALIETLLLWTAFLVLGLFTPINWESARRIAFLSLLVLLLSAWGIISQALFLLNINLPADTMLWLARSGHPVRIMYAVSFAVVFPTIALPGLMFARAARFENLLRDFCEQLSLLSAFYLLLDLAGLLVVVIRNVSG